MAALKPSIVSPNQPNDRFQINLRDDQALVFLKTWPPYLFDATALSREMLSSHSSSLIASTVPSALISVHKHRGHFIIRGPDLATLRLNGDCPNFDKLITFGTGYLLLKNVGVFKIAML